MILMSGFGAEGKSAQNVFGLFSRCNAQHSAGERSDLILIGESVGLNSGNAAYHWFGPCKRVHMRSRSKERPFRSDVDLFALSRACFGCVRNCAVVAAEMRRVHHLDGALILRAMRKSRETFNVLNEAVLDPVADQIEEADIAGCGPQVFQETRAPDAWPSNRRRSRVVRVSASTATGSSLPEVTSLRSPQLTG